MTEIEKLYTTKEVAKILKLHQITVNKFLILGRIKGIKIGNRWRVKESELRRFMDGKEPFEYDKTSEYAKPNHINTESIIAKRQYKTKENSK